MKKTINLTIILLFAYTCLCTANTNPYCKIKNTPTIFTTKLGSETPVYDFSLDEDNIYISINSFSATGFAGETGLKHDQKLYDIRANYYVSICLTPKFETGDFISLALNNPYITVNVPDDWQKYVADFDNVKINIPLSEINRLIEADGSDKNSYTVYIRVSYNAECSMTGFARHEFTETNSVIKNINLYRCSAGTITVDESVTPNIATSGAEAIYGIYNSNSGIKYPVLNSTSPNTFNITTTTPYNEYIACNIYDSNFSYMYENLKETEKLTSYDNYFTYASFLKHNNKLENGDIRYVQRMYLNSLFSCKSNILTFKAVDSLSLDGFDDSELFKYVCPYNEFDFEDPTGEDPTCSSGSIFSLKGKSINWDLVSFDKDIYGVEYGWQYKTSTNGNWYTITDDNVNNDETSPQDLCIKRSFFEADKKYYFRQVINLTKFNNRKVYANGENNFITVQCYKAPAKNNFTVNEVPSFCQNDVINDSLLIKFSPNEKYNYCSFYGADDVLKNNFQYTYKSDLDVLNGEKVDTSLSLPFTTVADSDIKSTITVTDGCGNTIDLTSTITVNSKPELLKTYIDIDGGSADYTTNDQILRIQAPQGENIILKMNDNDTEKNISRYYISYLTDSKDENGDYIWSEKALINAAFGHTISSSIVTKDWYSEACNYIKVEKTNISTGCTGDPIYICISYIGDINNNNITISGNTSYSYTYICKNDRNPLLNGDGVSGGYGDDTYSFIWQYSNDSINWINMMDADSKYITTTNLAANSWDKDIDKTYYIRRMATSLESNASESSAIKSYSNVLILKTYTTPVLAVAVNGSDSDLNICYGQQVTFSQSFKNNAIIQEEGYDFSFGYAYEKTDGTKVEFGNNATKCIVTKDSIIYAAVKFCNSTIYSDNAVSLTVGENLATNSSEVFYGDCKVRGNEVHVTVATKTGYNYGFIIDNDTIKGNTTDIPLPAMGSKSFSVIKSKNECSQATSFTIQNDEMQDALVHKELTVSSTGLDKNEDVYSVCAGNPIEISVTNESTGKNIFYSWSINNSILNSKMYASNSLVYEGVEGKGSSYNIIRTSNHIINGYTCQSLNDTVVINTYKDLSGASISINEDVICYNEDVTLTFDTSNIAGGSGDYSINWYRVYGSETELLDSLSYSYIAKGIKQSSAFYAIVNDDYCSDYSFTTNSKALTVEKNLNFNLTASPSRINKNLVADGASVSVNVTSEEIASAEKIDVWFNSNQIKSKEAYISGITQSVKQTDFSDNIATFNVTRYGSTDNTCTATQSVELFLNEGFDGIPVILSSESEISPSTVCGGDSVILSIDLDNLPKYDNSEIAASSFTYQWYKRNGGNWSTCGSTNTIRIAAIAGNETEYRCKLSYKPTGGTLQSVISDNFKVIGKSSVSVGSISFKDEDITSKIFYICKGQSGSLTLINDSSFSANGKQWYQRIGSGDWEAVSTNGNTTGTNELTCTIDLENYNANTSFKFVATNDCNVQSESTNQIQLLINAGSALTENDIYLTSSPVFDGTKLDSIILCVPRDYNNTYYWTADASLNNSSWSTGNPVIISNGNLGFNEGLDSVFVYMVSKGKGNCPSDTITYHFNAFKRLTASTLQIGSGNDTICKNSGSVTLQLNDIKGGDGEYKIDWYYKSEQMTNFALISEDNSYMPFTFEDIINGTRSVGSYSYLTISNLEESCEFYAVVSCTGKYTGGNLVTKTVSKNVYSDLSGGGIDVSTEVLCYGDAFTNISGTDASGSTGEYNYQWLKADKLSSGERGEWQVISEQTESNFKGLASQDRYKLYNTTYFCRVVSDECGNKDTSKIKTVQVKDEIKIFSDDILYTQLIARGDKAKMWGVVNGYEYIWFDKNRLALDTTDVRGIYTSENINESVSTFYTKIISDGCTSTNYDTVTINAYDIDGGHLTFNDFDNETSEKYWICSGKNAGSISVDGSGDLSYRWFYTINDEGSARAYTLYSANNTASPIVSCNVDLDTCNLKTIFANASGTTLEKKVSFFRVSYFTIDGVEQTENSDTISVYIVPTLNQVSKLLLDGTVSMAGTITGDKEIYCSGESGQLINGTVETTSSLYNIWSNGGFGPYLYDKQAPEFTTWFEYGNGSDWEKSDIHIGISDYAQFYNLQTIDTTYSVRRAFSDGCTTAYSDEIKQILSDRKATLSYVSIKGKTQDGSVIADCFEFGDALAINYTQLGYDCYWFSDKECTDTIVSNNLLVNISEINEETPTTLYLKRKDNGENGCFSSALEIPLSIYTKSDGGIIYKDQNICYGSPFSKITNGKLASGYSYSPINGTPRSFTYQWQISMDNNASVWTDILDAVNPEELSEEQINNAISGTVQKYYIRRKAINECGRACYSNVITLSYFDPFKAGNLALENCTKNTFCYTDSLPFITTTSPEGGYYGSVEIDGYSYGWDISFDGENYVTVSSLSQMTSKRVDLNYLIKYSGLVDIDFNINNTIYIRAAYQDNCGSIYSEPLSFTIFAKVIEPSIYQDKDSCNADAVTIKTYNADKYTYTWVIFDENDQITWSYTQDSLKVQRISELNVAQYGVVGVNKETGCISGYTYFNVDSLPELNQGTILPLNAPVCYGASTFITGSEISGGNGDKSYIWQYSYDSLLFENIATTQDLSLNNLKSSMYVRRIIIDKCDIDTSNTIFIPVNKKITMDPSLFILSDYKCEGQKFNIKINPTIDDSINSLYVNNGFDHVYYNIVNASDSSEYTQLGQAINSSYYNFNGIEGSSNNYYTSLITVDTAGNICESEKVTVTAYTALAISTENNIIKCSSLTPCNEEIVSITGTVPVDNNTQPVNFKYSWFTSSDNITWNEILFKNDINLDIKITDTIYVKRKVTNGCDTLSSNTITFIGQKLMNVDYETEFNLSITTTQLDSSSAVILSTNDSNLRTYGNGIIPTLSVGKNELPYSAEDYADSLLYIQKTGSECVTSYHVTPLYDGRIHIDGGGIICPNESVSPIVATELQGGNGEYSYQWQYKNEYVDEYVNIPSAIEKTYTPVAIDVKTWYRRISYSGIYTAFSNEISVEIAPSISVAYIHSDKDSAFFVDHGLEYTDFSIQKTPSLSVTLIDTVKNASLAYWEFSDDNITWEKAVSIIDLTTPAQKLTLCDSIPVRYYRLIAINECNSDTTEAFKVVTTDTPIIFDDDMVITVPKCYGDDAFVKCYDNADHTYSGEYAYKYSGYEGEMYQKIYTSYDSPYNGELTRAGTYFKNVTESFTLTITRVSLTTGIETTYDVNFVLEPFNADYTFTVNNVEYDQTATDVAIQQGALVQFNNKTENAVSYYWELIQPLNTDLSAVTPYGLFSYQENPSSYFYNGGEYTITFIATNEHGCSDTIINNAINLPEENVRAGYGSVFAEFVEEGAEPIISPSFIEVYPTFINDVLTISYPNANFDFLLFANDGRLLRKGSGFNSVNLNVSDIVPGSLLVVVNGQAFKCVKQ